MRRGAPAKSQQLAGEGGGTLSGVHNLIHEALQGAGWRNFRPQQIRIAGDHRENVAEVARHSARQAGHRVHLLVVQGLLSQLTPLADVAEDQDGAPHRSRIVAQGRGAVLNGHLGAVAREEHRVVVRIHPDPVPNGASERALDRLAGLLVDQVHHDGGGFPARLGPRPARESLGQGIQESDASFPVGRKHRIANVRKRGRQQTAALPPRESYPGEEGRQRHECDQRGQVLPGRRLASVGPNQEVPYRRGGCRTCRDPAGASMVHGTQPHGHQERQKGLRLQVGVQIGLQHQ